MTTLIDRPADALLVIDVQNGVVAAAHAHDSVIAKIGLLVEKARRAGTAVIWVQHADQAMAQGSDEWQLVPELAHDAHEPRVQKNFGDAFEATDLEAVLSVRRVGRLFVVGAQTDACIRSTLHGALTRGYDVMLVADAHTTEDLTPWGAPPPAQVIAHTNLYWSSQTAPGRTAGTVEAEDVAFGAAS